MIRMLLLLLGALIVLAQPAIATERRASLPDIEDEVMCPTCGVPLAHAFSPQAEQQRQFIRDEIESGKTKQQIKDALVAEFGEDVLATPRGTGFDLSAYVVPVALLLVGAIAIAIALLRWRARPTPGEPLPDIAHADAARLERDLSRYGD
jgi:cytochrome c-type biogenesis protein CcmH/NrfF